MLKMSFVTRRSASLAGATAVAALLAGCVQGPDFKQPDAPAVDGYTARPLPASTVAASAPGGGGQRFVKGGEVDGDWWELFRSRQINAFVEEAVANHPDIAAAEAALRQARELAAADGANYFPSVSASGEASRNFNNGGVAGAPASYYGLFSVSAPVSYSPDIWGKTSRTVEGALAAADASKYQLEAAYLSLTGNVVVAAITDAELAAEIRVTHELIASYRGQLDLMQKQFDLGAVSEADLLSEKAALAQIQATLPPLEKQRAANRNQLMAYLGRLPSQDKGESVALEQLHLPDRIPVSLPSALVHQRPDVAAAEAQLHEASAAVGVATANMLPSVTLSALYDSAATAGNQLFGPQTAFWTLGATTSASLFDGGGAFHSREVAVAGLDKAKAQYKSTVLSAFQNVASALQAIKSDADALHARVAASSAAQKSFAVAKVQFQGGSTAFNTVLNAEETMLNARLALVAAETTRFTDSVALYAALGGGWWKRDDETPAAKPKPTDLIGLSPVASAVRAGLEPDK